MPHRIALARSLAPLALVLALGCEGAATAPETGELRLQAVRVGKSDLTEDQQALARRVVAASARFHSAEQAEAAGYVRMSECVAVPGLGGMGYHYSNRSLVNPVFDPLQPEALLYVEGPGGNLRLIGVEYIVIKAGQPAPTFAGYPFDDGGTPTPAPHWSLHAWLWQANPRGTFVNFNPTVSCD